MSLTPIDLGAVPIVGQPFQVKLTWPSALIICNCEAKAPMVLIGVGTIGACPSCGNKYAIAKGGQLVIGQVVSERERLPEGTV